MYPECDQGRHCLPGCPCAPASHADWLRLAERIEHFLWLSIGAGALVTLALVSLFTLD